MPLVSLPPPHIVAVRGRLRNGSAAALIVEPTGVCIVAPNRSSLHRVRRFTIPAILAVEEHRLQRSSDLLIVTVRATISVTAVDIAQAWAFCRELRQRILHT